MSGGQDWAAEFIERYTEPDRREAEKPKQEPPKEPPCTTASQK